MGLRPIAILVATLSPVFGTFAAILYDGPEWPPAKPEFDKDAASHPARAERRLVEPMPDFSRPHEVRVGNVGGTPRLFIDGNPFPLFCGRVATNARHDGKPRLADLPFNVVVVDDKAHNKLFPTPGEMDASCLMARGALFAEHSPSNAYFIWEIKANPSRAWAAENPGEICMDSAGEPNADGGSVNWSEGSRKAVEEINTIVGKAIDAIESSQYANRVIGYLLASCHTLEWLGWDPKDGRATDFSAPAKAAFREFARHRYGLENAEVPPPEARRAPGGRLVWNPRENLAAVAFNEWISEQMADNLSEICGNVRRRLGGRKLVGAYYGYSMTLPAYGDSQHRAHFALERVLREQPVDFLMSPQDYMMRTLGESSIDMKPFASIAAHGILPVIENDIRTHFGRFIGVYPKGYSQTHNAFQSQALVRRDLATYICRNQMPYLYDLALGAGYSFPECVRDGAPIAAANRWCVERGTVRRAEVAVVASERSVTASPELVNWIPGGVLMPAYTKEGMPRQSVQRPRRLYAAETGSVDLSRLARIGAPIDYLLAEDLPFRVGDYKMYVFLNCTRMDGAVREAVRRIQSRPCTLLWTYAPGYIDGIDASESSMRELTGFDLVTKTNACEAIAVFPDGTRMGTPKAIATPMFEVRGDVEALAHYSDGSVAIASRTLGPSRAVYSGVWLYDTAFLRRLAKESGVHSFIDTDDPVEANDDFFVLHARRGGRKTVHLRTRTSVVDVFKREIVARDADSFEFDAPLHSTHLFYSGNAADAFLRTVEP